MPVYETTDIEALSSIPNPWCEVAGSGLETSEDLAFILVYVGLMLMWVLNTTIGSYGCYHLFYTDDDTPRILKRTYCAVCFFFFLLPPGWAFGIQSGWQCWYGGEDKDFIKWEGTYMIGLDGYFYGLVFCNVFFMLRLNWIFRKTALQLNERLIWVPFAIVILTLLCLPFAATVLFLSGWENETRNHALRCCTAFNILSVVSNTWIMWVFIKRIVSLSEYTSKVVRSNSSSRSTEENTATDIVDEEHHKDKVQIDQDFMDAITRYAVTGAFVCLSTWVMIVYSFMFAEIPALTMSLKARAFYLFLSGLDGSVSLISLSLQFKFSQNIYYKRCSCVNRRCGLCLMRWRKIEVKPRNRGNESTAGSNDSSKPTTNTTATRTIGLEMSMNVSN
eukprot:407118_1